METTLEEETQSDVEDLPSEVLDSEVEAPNDQGEHARSFGANMDILTLPLAYYRLLYILLLLSLSLYKRIS